MTPDISERAFEAAIKCALLRGGPDACPGDVAAVRESPPTFGDDPGPGGYHRRRPDDYYDRSLCLIPADVVDFLFAVVRPLRFSEQDEQSVDLTLFLNGIPIFTAELKNLLNGQDVQDAIRQYREDRDPREPLFAYARCLAHFAVDPEQVFVTTCLAGPKTRFLPFNRGRFGGAGNPPVPPTRAGFPTDYLWEEVWARDSVLDLVRQFIHEVETEDDGGRKTGAHSAGSGKSFTIAWLAHQPSVLHDRDDRRVFDSVVVVTDRRVHVRSGPGTVRLGAEDAARYAATRFGASLRRTD